MVGTRKKPKGIKSYSYKKIIFDKYSESFYATDAQLDLYRKNEVDRIIQDHQNGVCSMKHELEIAELISISYYCWFGRQPTCRVGNNGKFPYVFKKYHSMYNEAWLAVAMRLLNSFKVGKGSWYSYIVFAKRDGLRSLKSQCDKEEEAMEDWPGFEAHMKSCHYLNHDKWHTNIVKSAQY